MILKHRQTVSRLTPTFRFSVTAFAKLLYLRDYGGTEVGGFGISAEDDLLLVTDFQLVKQVCTPTTVEFDDDSVADFFDEQVDRGLKPDRFARVWIHTHPGDSPQPSSTDEATFARVFGHAQWAVMFILACGGQSYARLRFGVGPGGAMEIPIEVDFELPFAGSDHDSWEAEYLANVTELSWPVGHRSFLRSRLPSTGDEIQADENLILADSDPFDDYKDGWDLWDRYLELEQQGEFL